MKLRKSHVAEFVFNAMENYALPCLSDPKTRRSEKQIARDFGASLSPNLIEMRVSGQVFHIKISIPRDKGGA